MVGMVADSQSPTQLLRLFPRDLVPIQPRLPLLTMSEGISTTGLSSPQGQPQALWVSSSLLDNEAILICGPILIHTPAGILSAFILVIGGICICSRRARNRFLFFRRTRLLNAPSRKVSREPFQFGTTTTFISGPDDSMQQTRSMSTTSLRSSAAHQYPQSHSSTASHSVPITDDERTSIVSGLRQHPVSIITESEASFATEPPAEHSSNNTVIVGRDSIRPYPATRGFGAPRDSTRTSTQTWTITEAATPRSDRFEYDGPDESSTPQMQMRASRTDASSTTDSIIFNRNSKSMSAFSESGLSPPPPLPPSLVAPDRNPFRNKPQVPGMVYLPSRLTSLQTQQASRVVQTSSFAPVGSGGWVEHGQSNQQRDGTESSGESLVEVTDLRRDSQPLSSPGSQFSRPTSSESEGISSEFSSEDGMSETHGLVATTGLDASVEISGKR